MWPIEAQPQDGTEGLIEGCTEPYIGSPMDPISSSRNLEIDAADRGTCGSSS